MQRVCGMLHCRFCGKIMVLFLLLLLCEQINFRVFAHHEQCLWGSCSLQVIWYFPRCLRWIICHWRCCRPRLCIDILLHYLCGINSILPIASESSLPAVQASFMSFGYDATKWLWLNVHIDLQPTDCEPVQGLFGLSLPRATLGIKIEITSVSATRSAEYSNLLLGECFKLQACPLLLGQFILLAYLFHNTLDHRSEVWHLYFVSFVCACACPGSWPGQPWGLWCWNRLWPKSLVVILDCLLSDLHFTKLTKIKDFPLMETGLFTLVSYSAYLIAEAADLTGEQTVSSVRVLVLHISHLFVLFSHLLLLTSICQSLWECFVYFTFCGSSRCQIHLHLVVSCSDPVFLKVLWPVVDFV